MINSWSKFNESSNSDIRNQIHNHLSDIRDVFVEFEDMKIISYGFDIKDVNDYISCGYILNYYDDSRIDRYIDYIVSFFGSTYNDCRFVVNIKLPSTTDNNETFLDLNGINFLDNIIVASQRLSDIGYAIKLDMNSNHHQYKPAKLLIEFKLSK